MNAFEELAEQQTPKAVKRRRQHSDEEIKRDKEQHTLGKAYKKYKEDQLQAALNGPCCLPLSALIVFLKNLTFDDAEKLCELCTLFKDASENDRYLALELISEAIMKMRVKAGLTPFEDALPGEEPTAFEIIKGVLFP